MDKDAMVFHIHAQEGALVRAGSRTYWVPISVSFIQVTPLTRVDPWEWNWDNSR
jgi:hypothetical protein